MRVNVGFVIGAQDLIERAFKRVKKRKVSDKEAIVLFRDSLVRDLERIVRGFPSFDSVPDFYKEVLEDSFGIVRIKKALASLSWASKKIIEVSKKLSDKRAFYGRACSIIKRISKQLVFLEELRKGIKELPVFKELFTVAITGFPNVGKTTLFYKITGSKPEINNYAFTTKRVNVGYLILNDSSNLKIQFLDTPGTLNRMNKMNRIEKQAFLAMKYIADMIVFVITKDYEIKRQIRLLNRVLSFKKPVVVFIGKKDFVDDDFLKQVLEHINDLKSRIGSDKEYFGGLKVFSDVKNLLNFVRESAKGFYKKKQE